jgi:hypothetical protein
MMDEPPPQESKKKGQHDFNTHKSDFYTQSDFTRRVILTRISVNNTLTSVITTRTNMITTRRSVISTRKVQFLHAEFDFKRKV